MTTQTAQLQPRRHLPVRPNLTQLRHQAKELLRQAARGEATALAEFAAVGASLKLVDAQFVLARIYGVSSWTRLVQACAVADAIWDNDVEALRTFLLRNPKLVHEPVRAQPDNWGSPLSYAANLGRDAIIAMLWTLGATDVQYGFMRACLQGRLKTARRLIEMGAQVEPGMVMGPCETLNADGLAFLLELGAEVADANGEKGAPLGMILQTYARDPGGKHRCLEVLAKHGVELPDTPTIALHRGRRDQIKAHLRHNPKLFTQQFSHEEIFPQAVGCSLDPTDALHGTPLAGTTLLHLAVDYDERELLSWMLAEGATPDAPAAVDADGFGGHTAIFGTVVNQPYRAGRPGSEALTRQLLEAGADPTYRASLRKALRFVSDESLHEYRNVTPREWGERFHDPDWVNPAALALL